MRILFCDDNLEVLRQLHFFVSSYFASIGNYQPEYGLYSSGDALIQNEKHADIAFLDIEMPGTSGIHIGSKLKEYNPYIKIFIVTSYPDYLDEAMRFQVFRYLSKPIDKNRLFRNLKDAIYQYNMETREYPIVTHDRVVICRAEEIICVEAIQRKTLVHTTDGILISTETMEYWKKTLTLPCFFSTHRSFLVNMRFVNTIYKDIVGLKHGDYQKNAYLARRRFSLFKDTYLLYLESVK